MTAVMTMLDDQCAGSLQRVQDDGDDQADQVSQLAQRVREDEVDGHGPCPGGR